MTDTARCQRVGRTRGIAVRAAFAVAFLFAIGTARTYAQTAHWGGTIGAQLYSQGGAVSVTVQPASAGYTSQLWLFAPGAARYLGVTNHMFGATVNVGTYPAGEELVFGIFVTNTGTTFRMGPGSRNPDGIPHAAVLNLSPTQAKVGFEDLYGGGDRDYDDNVFTFTGAAATPPPPPNVAPGVSFAGAGPIECARGVPTTLAGSVNDSDNDALVVRWIVDSVVVSAQTLAAGTTGSSVPVSTSTMLALGWRTVSLSADDGHGHTTTVTRSALVQDTTPPVVALNGANPTVLECPEPYVELGAVVSDACDDSPSLSISGFVDTDAPGTYVVAYTATDASGNGASAMRTIVVRDTTPPVVALNGANPTVLECPEPYVELGAVVSDTCDPAPTYAVTGVVESGSVGVYTLTYTAMDRSGNSASATRTVVVRDTTPPAITASLKQKTEAVESPGRSGAKAAEPAGFMQVTYAASDAVDTAPTVTASISGIRVENSSTIKYTLAPGVTTTKVTYIGADKIMHIISNLAAQLTVTATDATGNTETKISSIEAPAAAPELLAGPAVESASLGQNFPNPFNPETWIPFRLAQSSDVAIRIYDAAGALVRELSLGTLPAGGYGSRGTAAYWDGRTESGESAASGVYFYEIRAAGYREMRRMAIAK